MPVAPRDFTRNVSELVPEIIADVNAFLGIDPSVPVAFTQQPTVNPLTGTAGQTIYTAMSGVLSNGATPVGEWTDFPTGTALASGTMFAPLSSYNGQAIYQEGDPTGTVLSDPITVTVNAGTVIPDPGTGVTPPSTSLPPSTKGPSGNTVSHAQLSMGRGETSEYFSQGRLNLPNLDQVWELRSHIDGSLVDNVILDRTTTKSDHSIPVADAWPNGDILAACTRHNQTNNVKWVIRKTDGTKIFGTLTATNLLTYPRAIIDRNGKAWLLIRENNKEWIYWTKDNQDAPWSSKTTFLTDSQQLYARQIRYDEVNHVINMWVAPNNALAAYGSLKLLQIDCATGRWRDANGFRANPTTAFTYSSIPTLLSSNSTYKYNAIDMTNDGKVAIIARELASNVNETEIFVWRLKENGDRWSLGDWEQGAPILNQKLRMSTQSEYQLGSCFDRASPQNTTGGFRFFSCRADTTSGVVWNLDQYDSPDGVTWTRKILRTSANLLSRPMTIERAVASSPVNYCEFVGFNDFASYTDATSAWIYKDTGA